MNFYIPKEIPSSFIEQYGLDKVIKVPIQPVNGGKITHCLDNVKRYLSRNEGQIQFGWIFSMLGKFIIKQHGHAVVKLNKGTFICVSPPEIKLEYILFSPDQSIEDKIVNNRLPTQSFALVNDDIVKRFVQLENEGDVGRLRGDRFAEDKALTSKNLLASEFISYAQSKTGRNDPCYCGSTKKYKQCCGK